MTTKAAVIVVISVCIVFGIVNTHVFIMFTLHTDGFTSVCIPRDHYFNLESVIVPWLDITLYTLLPSSLVIIINIVILYKIKKSTSMGLAQEGTTQAQKSLYRIVPMLLLVSTVFVVCTLPAGIFFIGKCSAE